MAVDERRLDGAPPRDPRLTRARRFGFGLGLLKGMAVTMKHLFKHNTVIQYPDEKQDLPARTRGVIALKEENCTVCMLCARECPDWCIYIDSHKETLPPKRQGGRPRKRNVLDRFAIDYALCMYCGICVEVCPYDALFWSREFEYIEYDIRELTHEKERLSDWMATVLPPPALEAGAELPGMPAAAGTPAVAAGAAGPGSAQRPAPPAQETAAAERPEQADQAPAPAPAAAPSEPAATASQEQAGETTSTQASATEAKTDAQTEAKTDAQTEAKTDAQTEAKTDAQASPADTSPPDDDASRKPSGEEVAALRETPGPNVEVPHEVPRPVALTPSEDPQGVYDEVLSEQLAKGSSPQVAEARAKVARVKAERGIARAPSTVPAPAPVASAPPKGVPTEPTPSGAPDAEEPQPPQGPVAPEGGEATDKPRKKRRKG